MGRIRVFSFMSRSSSQTRQSTPSPPPSTTKSTVISKVKHQTKDAAFHHQAVTRRPVTPPTDSDYGSPVSQTPESTSPPASPVDSAKSAVLTTTKRSSRPLSISGGYIPPLMEVNEDTIPELLPIFSLLNSHSNKLYQEGYFLKLEDQNTQGKANADRTWTECFAQLVGTVLSLWDAAELDAAGEDGEVLPKFINLTDASLKMIDSLPTRSNDEQPLQHILSLSTAGKNRYLLHFNSHHSLVQWTAGIRLAMFEHSVLQEAYTGALIAGKAKQVNNINVIMDRTRFKIEDWVRVRFGAGTPWRRCWCVITPPDEKEVQKMQKEMKKKSPYDRSHAPALKGDIKFYDQRIEGKKQKKQLPIASIHDAYSAFAIYPQAKSLVDASTLMKIEGNICIHTDPPTSSEGFVFVMPETRPMVNGFETMLRFLFPTWDTFGLYGRPGKLVASTLDSRSLMFAMPKHRKHSYLELLDVSSLTVDPTASTWDEREWRRQLKEATGKRMNDVEEGVRSHARSGSNQSGRLSYHAPPARAKVGFADDSGGKPGHMRNSSDPNVMGGGMGGGSPHRKPVAGHLQADFPSGSPSPSADGRNLPPPQELGGMRSKQTPEPVSAPPASDRTPRGRPNSAYHSPELRRANSRLSTATLAQLAKAGGLQPDDQKREGEGSMGPVQPSAYPMGNPANQNPPREGRSTPNQRGPPGGQPPPPLNLSANNRSMSPSPYGAPRSPYAQGPNSRPGTPGSGQHPPRSPLPPQGRGGPPGPPPHGGRGRGDGYGRGRGGPPMGPGGRGGPGGPGSLVIPRRPMGGNNYDQAPPSPYRDSVTPNVIIDHYTTEREAAQGLGPRVPPHVQGIPPGRTPYDDDRSRPGKMKTVGGTDPTTPINQGYDIPNVNFGPTLNYGAQASPRSQQGLAPGYPAQGQRPNTAQGREADRPPMQRQRSDYGDAPPQQQQRTMAWHPANQGPPTPGGGPGLSAEEYVQQRAAASSPYGHGRSGSGGSMYQDPGMGRGGPVYPPGGPQQGSSFSRPTRGPPQSPAGQGGGDPRMMPPAAQYGQRPQTPQSPRSQPPHYQGQAF